MKKINFSDSRFSKMVAGKGFYITLFCSLLAIGVAAFIAYNRSLDRLSSDDQNLNMHVTTSSQNEWGFPNDDDADAVDRKQHDIPKDTTTTTATEATTTTTSQKETISTKPANKPIKNPQPMVMPINGEIINPFSDGELVKSKTLGSWKTHDGVDIAATIGDNVKSMTDGTVKAIKEDPLWGVCIVIDHGDGLEAHYCNLSAGVTVKVDQEVKAGQVIGSVGETAEIEVEEGPHLHFGVKKDGKWVDPIKLINPL